MPENNERKKDSAVGRFVKNDARTVLDNVVYDHLVPGFIDMITEGLHSAIDMFFRSSSPSRYGRGRRSYDRYYDDRPTRYRDYYDDDRPRRRKRDYYDDRRNTRSLPYRSFDISDVEFASRDEAKEVLATIIDELASYESISLDAIYRIPIVRELSETTPDWTATRYGWTSVQGASVIQLSNRKWIIDMPPIERI